MNTDGGINHLDQLDNDHDGVGDPETATMTTTACPTRGQLPLHVQSRPGGHRRRRARRRQRPAQRHRHGRRRRDRRARSTRNSSPTRGLPRAGGLRRHPFHHPHRRPGPGVPERVRPDLRRCRDPDGARVGAEQVHQLQRDRRQPGHDRVQRPGRPARAGRTARSRWWSSPS